MTGRVRSLPAERIALRWNASASPDEAVERARAVVGMPCPRWAVMARAVACREDGMEMKQLPGPTKGAGG